MEGILRIFRTPEKSNGFGRVIYFPKSQNRKSEPGPTIFSIHKYLGDKIKNIRLAVQVAALSEVRNCVSNIKPLPSVSIIG